MKKISVLFVLFLSINSFAQKNLVANGGFEMELNDWRGDVAKLSN